MHVMCDSDVRCCMWSMVSHDKLLQPDMLIGVDGSRAGSLPDVKRHVLLLGCYLCCKAEIIIIIQIICRLADFINAVQFTIH